MPTRVRQPVLDGSVTACNAVSSQLAADYVSLHSWRAVGALYGVSPGMAYRVATQGYEPKDAVIRGRLGLVTLKPGRACPHCGQVHVAEVCTATPPVEAVQAVTVWAQRVRSGAVVLARSRRCARRRCGTHFVPVTPSQRYCSAECARRTKLVRSRR